MAEELIEKISLQLSKYICLKFSNNITFMALLQ